jgi:hypothetical protein
MGLAATVGPGTPKIAKQVESIAKRRKLEEIKQLGNELGRFVFGA